MTSGGSALVLVQPSDSVETIVANARQTGASSVELLVPADTGVLQNWRNVRILQQALAQSGIDFVLISSDDQVLQAGRTNDVMTIAIEGASVVGPLHAQPQRALRPARSVPETPPKYTPPIEHDLLDLLEQGSGAAGKPAAERGEPLPALAHADQEADFLATLDDLNATYSAPSATPPGSIPEPTYVADRETMPIRVPPPSRRTPTPVSDTGVRERAATRRSPRPSRATDTRPRRRSAEAADDVIADRRVRTGVSPFLIGGLILLALLAGAAIWALNSRVSVTIGAPVARVRELPIVNEPIPYSSTPTNDSASILAAAIAAPSEFTVQGKIATQTISPTGKAKGSVLVVNTTSQALALPAGTEFVGRNQQGTEVRFVVDAPITIPPSTTSTSLAGSSTTYGQVQVAVTARSAGAASNVPENTIRSILIPGQPLIDCVSSNPICRNDAISGGSDEPQWVVTEADVQRVLGEALTGLYNTGVQQLRAQTDGVKATVDASSIRPSPEELSQPGSYEAPIVTPNIGQPTDSQDFTLTVRTRFVALAVRPDRMLKDQLAQVVNASLAQRGGERCTAAEIAQPKLDNWVWDGTSLTINGTLQCSPRGVLGPEVRLQVLEALRGKSRAEAEAALRELQLQGLIGDYQIAGDAQQLPFADILINVQFAGQ